MPLSRGCFLRGDKMRNEHFGRIRWRLQQPAAPWRGSFQSWPSSSSRELPGCSAPQTERWRGCSLFSSIRSGLFLIEKIGKCSF